MIDSVNKKVFIIWLITLIASIIYYDLTFGITLIILTFVAFIQNMFFTWVSRSRNSGNPMHHRTSAWGSNGIWALTQAMIASGIYTPITNMINAGNIELSGVVRILITIFIYALATTEGSVFMMKINLGKIKVPKIFNFLVENADKRVGSK
ncbi:MAG: hypothetical protein ACOC33_00380 [bacterium]